MTIVSVPLIDRLGRIPLLVYPMFFMILDFIALTLFLVFSDRFEIFKIFSVACIVLFIMCFAVGLGPIPYVYVAECFRQEARSAGLSICMFTNWTANLILTLTFTALTNTLNQYVFLVFALIVGIILTVVVLKVPETKGKNLINYRQRVKLFCFKFHLISM
jgi:MFS family permease